MRPPSFFRGYKKSLNSIIWSRVGSFFKQSATISCNPGSFLCLKRMSSLLKLILLISNALMNSINLSSSTGSPIGNRERASTFELLESLRYRISNSYSDNLRAHRTNLSGGRILHKPLKTVVVCDTHSA
jgi:hypothetical protein